MAGESKGRYASFTSFFRFELLPTLEKLERVRKLRLRVLWLTAAGLLVFWFLSYLALGRIFIYGMFWFLAVPVVLCAAALRFLDAEVFRNRERAAMFSREVVAKTVLHARPGLIYKPTGHVRFIDFVRSGLFGHEFNSMGGRDFFWGEGRGYTIGFSWLDVRYIPKRKLHEKDRYPARHFFTGWYFVVYFRKRFDGETLLTPDVAEASLGWLGRRLQEFTSRGDRVIRLEDVEFEKLFRVLSTGEMDARYVLTPPFMRAATRVGSKLDGKLCLVFRSNCMYAAVPAAHRYFGRIPKQSFLSQDFSRRLYHAAIGIDELAKTVVKHQKVWAE